MITSKHVDEKEEQKRPKTWETQKKRRGSLDVSSYDYRILVKTKKDNSDLCVIYKQQKSVCNKRKKHKSNTNKRRKRGKRFLVVIAQNSLLCCG
jgi:hypothetical protein